MEALYPKAVYKADGYKYGAFTGGPWKFVIHTTETSTMPGYRNGYSSPHLTYNPKDRTFTQHVPFTSSCGALRDESGGIRTNRDGAIQLEIICYSDKKIADQRSERMWVGDLPQTAYDDIADLAFWLHEDRGIELEARMPRPTPKYGVNSPARMSNSEWDNFNGICGHFEVPENTHWDPGAFDFTRLITLSQERFIVARFKDVPVTHNFYDEIEWMAEAGISTGVGNDKFAPDANVTRGQMSAFLYRFYRYLEKQ